YANRIAKGKFSLEGKNYILAVNNGVNHLHGGNKGFSRVVWDAKKENDTTLTLNYLSKDGEENYPGNLQVKVIYRLTKNALEINYEATTDKTTIINLTNHTYFNLNGEGSGNIDGHSLMIAAKKFTPIDATMIPTGEIKNVQGTPFDFQRPQNIGAGINDSADLQIKFGGGYDHNFVLDKLANRFEKVAEISSDHSRIGMDIFTTEPGLQFYSGNFMDGTHILKSGVKDNYRTAFCLETQHFPDSPNEVNFPSTVLKPGEIFRSKTTYAFGIKN
ncbi:MAG: aldose epimerase family protein, partial [Chitinophagaceae bacterium]